MIRLENVRGVLLDIEGTTSSISFVHDVMFPYARQHLVNYVRDHWDRPAMANVREQVARDDGQSDWTAWLRWRSDSELTGGQSSEQELLEQRIMELMDGDVKATGLKSLQGLIWESGFRSGELRSHVYPDVLPAIEAWRASSIDVRIYSSGSIAAQKLFFGHVDGQGNGQGDCLNLFTGHYDTTIGSKRESASYLRIAEDWSLAPGEIVFVSDLEPELAAARAAGLQVVASLRPGNAPLPAEPTYPAVKSFAELAF